MTIWEARSRAVKYLQAAQNDSKGRFSFDTPSLDVDCLLAHVLNENRTYLIAHNQDFLEESDEKDFFALVEKRVTGTPIAYLLGTKEFFGFDFLVTPDVLIPKADTEILVEKALECLNIHFLRSPDNFSFADICTGSGCVALSILKTVCANDNAQSRIKKITCHATDLSASALNIASKNAQKLLEMTNGEVIQFFEGDLLSPLKGIGSYDMIVSNPPYVPKNIVDVLLEDGRKEPRMALDGDAGSDTSSDGLFIIKRLVPQVFNYLKSNGSFLIETGEYNALDTSQMMQDVGFVDVATFSDLSGQPRVTFGRKP